MKSQVNRSQELLRLIGTAQLQSTLPNEVSRVLYQLQNDLNAQYFGTFSHEDKEIAFKEIWKLLLYCASHTSSSVRLSAYRLTGCFLLKIQPYYTTQIQKTFSDVSTNATIDIKSSAIIASSFAFLSNRISLPYLSYFIDSTPVYHHFTISDPIFAEHLSSIISNLGELGFEWFSTLLHSFLALIQNSSDRYLIKSIAAIIKHDPLNLFNDVLQFIYDQKDFKDFLSLVSFIITSNEILQNSNLNLYKIAQTAMDVLEHQDSCNATQIDSAMQVLNIRSNSFKVETNLNENGSLEIVLNSTNNDQNDQSIQINMDINNLVSRPSFYLFDLPLQITLPTENDSQLTFSAKMRSLAKHANKHTEKACSIFDVFLQNYSSKYNEKVSSVLQGVSDSIPTFIKFVDKKVLIPFLENAIFSSPSNWFHSADQLNLIKCIPPESFNDLFGSKGLKRIGNLLIKLALSQNEQVSKKSIKVLRRIVNENNFKDLTLLISKRIDIYDSFNLIHLLPLLTNIVNNMKGCSTDHLNFLILQLFELTDLYINELNVLTEIFLFFGCFNLNFVSIKTITNAFFTALSIIFASITCVTGFSDWPFSLPNGLLKSAMEMVEVDIRSKNIDVSSEDSLNYDYYLRPCVSAMKFVYVIPVKFVTKNFILTFYDKLRNIFPYESALFIQKYWETFLNDERVETVIKMDQSLRYIQSYESAALVCRLYIKVFRIEYKEKLKACSEDLRKIADFVEKNPQYTTNEQRILFKAIKYFTNEPRSDPTPEFEKEVIENIPDLYTNLFNKLYEIHKETPKEPTIIELAGFDYKPVPDLHSKLELSDPCVKTQIIHSTREFSNDEYQQLLNYYVECNDINGIDLIIRCCYTSNIKLDIKGLTFPKKSLPILIRYLRAMKLPELESILASLPEDEQQPSSIQRARIYATSNKYIEMMKTAEKIKKDQLKLFAQTIFIHDYSVDDLIAASLHCLEVAKSTNKLRYSLKVTMSVLSRLETISDDYLESLIILFHQREDELDTYSASICLYLIAQKLQQPNDKLNIYITHLIANISQAAPEICILYSALFFISSQDPLFNQTLHKVIEHLFYINQPSLFNGGVKLFSKAFEIFSNKNLDILMRKCFPEILQLLPKFGSYFTISEKTVPVIMHVFKTGSKKQQLTIFNCHASLIPSPSSASFVYYTNLLASFITYSDGVKWQINDYNNLINVTRQMLTSPGNEALLHSYIKIISLRAEAIQGTPKRESLVMDEVDKFLEKGLNFCDYYQIHHTIFDWCLILLKENGINQTLPIISSLIFKKSPRFFPAFTGVAIFLNYYKNSVKNTREKDMRYKMNNALISTGKLMFNENARAHGVAIALLTINESLRKALTLAMFESDCERSEQIVQEVLKSHPNLLQ